jgi:hypothetical protein
MLTRRPGTTMTFLAGLPSMNFWLRWPGGGFDGGLVGFGGNADGAAQLAVDLHHQLDLVLLQRGRVAFGKAARPASAPGFSSA